MVLLIGNYPLDNQPSMHLFAAMMRKGLDTAGIKVELISPKPFFGRVRAGNFVTKWLAYVDKFLLFRWQLRRHLKDRPAVVHICDHSNAIYANYIRSVPVIATCHDLLAVRGALGEETDCPASVTGKVLQRWIISGLEATTAIGCVSRATFTDAQRLVRQRNGSPRIEMIPLGLNYPYRPLDRVEAQRRLGEHGPALLSKPFALGVGSNLTRKNRSGVLRIFALCKEKWNGVLVLAGEPLSDELRSLSRELGICDRVIEFSNAPGELLEALYSFATALLFPSTFEGFGWPIAEAHACGCPVICSNREPMTEVAGGAALVREVEDEAGFAADLLCLTDPQERARWSAKSIENARRFSHERMIEDYCELYRSVSKL